MTGVRRRRLPLRPRRHARPRRRRLRPPPPAARRDGRRPGAGRHEADRRAVGRRARRLPRGRLPGPVRGVERRLPRRRARRLARPAARRPTWRARLAGSSDTFAERPRPARRRQLRHRARRLHAPRPRVLRRRSTTRRTARATATATDHNRSWNSGVEGPTDDPAILEVRRRRAARHARHAAHSRRACRCCWPATSAAARSGGNNNAYCHDTPRTWLHWDDDWLCERRARA